MNLLDFCTTQKWKATFKKELKFELPNKVKFINCGDSDTIIEFKLHNIEILKNGDIKLYFGAGGECIIKDL